METVKHKQHTNNERLDINKCSLSLVKSMRNKELKIFKDNFHVPEIHLRKFEYFKETLQINTPQAFMLLFALVNKAKKERSFMDNNKTSIDSLTDFFNLEYLEVVPFQNELLPLYKKGYIDYDLSNAEEFEYRINNVFVRLLVSNDYPGFAKLKRALTPFRIIKILGESLDKFNITHLESMLLRCEQLLSMHPALSWILSKINLLETVEDKIRVIRLVYEYTVKERTEFTPREIIEMADSFEQFIVSEFEIEYAYTLEEELIKKGFLTYKTPIVSNSSNLSLTDEFKWGIDNMVGPKPLKTVKVEKLRVVGVKNMKSKKLFYNSDFSKEIDKLCIILEHDLELPDNPYINSTGINMLFYGDPGTGKTETVYQLGRQLGREVLQLDISAIRDMWVGESEKNLTRVFWDYKVYAQSSKKMPILLFNEADAILGRRMHVNSSVDQMNNSMQNILLEELENFSGIFIATTNLNGQLDVAFERRFLFKLRFAKPEDKVRSKILSEYFPWMKSKDAIALASQFEFTGGQLANVAKRLFIEQEILKLKKEKYLSRLTALLEEELGYSGARLKPIGF